MLTDTKVCSHCKLEKPVMDFNRLTKARDGLQPRCRQCAHEYHLQYTARNKVRCKARYQAHKAEHDAATAKWAKQNPTRRKEIYTRYRNKNLEKVRAGSRESSRRNYPNHIPYVRENSRRYRARKKNAPGLVTPAEWAFVKALFGGCAYCGGQDKITQDHMIPLIRGGHHVIENIIPACLNCNSQKRTKTYDEFVDRQVA